MKKLFFLIVIVAVLMGGYYVWQKSIDGTSSWQTFRSEKHGYEVKYPAGGDINRVVEEKVITISLERYLEVPASQFQKKVNEVGGALDFFTEFEVTPEINNPTNLPLKDWLDENVFSGHRASPPVVQREIVFAGEPALYTEQEHTGKNGIYAYTSYKIYLLHKSSLFTISSVKLPESPTPEWLAHPYYQYLEKSIPISEAILNSFRFTN